MTTKRNKLAGQLLKEAAATHAARNKQYDARYQTHGDLMRVLFPRGLLLETPADHARFGVLTLCVSKLERYAAQWRAGHKDSARDLIVYAALLEELTP